MQNENDVQQIQIEESQAREAVALSDALNRLSAHPDFNKVILQYLFKDEPVRLTALLADPEAKASNETQVAILDNLKMISELQQTLRAIHVIGNMARNSLADLQAAQSEADEDHQE